ncbi:MAG: glycerophosphoryl diester phosphodiesterase membrane domain-containing protein [Patescibacteria group bacterium]|nr:glycerophosphoryl diester phosphodiesterase membrane domain-containing protein [Patescibacteria group bacterium]
MKNGEKEKLISFFDIIYNTFEKISSNWVKYSVLSIISTIPNLLLIFNQFLLEKHEVKNLIPYNFLESFNLYDSLKNNSYQTIIIILFMILHFFLYTFIQISIILLTENPNKRIKDIFIQSSKSFFAMVWTNLIAISIIFGGFVIFIIPGIIFLAWYIYVPFCVIDGNHGTKALKESKALVKGRFWQTILKVFFIYVVFNLIASLIEQNLNLIKNLWSFDKTNFINYFAYVIEKFINFFLTTIPITVSFYLLYKSAKNNKNEEPVNYKINNTSC